MAAQGLAHQHGHPGCQCQNQAEIMLSLASTSLPLCQRTWADERAAKGPTGALSVSVTTASQPRNDTPHILLY